MFSIFHLFIFFILAFFTEPPKVVISPKNQSFTTGSEVSIRCSATGYPKPTIVWTHNDMFIIGSNRQGAGLFALSLFYFTVFLVTAEFLFIHRYRFIPEGTLIIKRAIPKDAGLYGCLASNSAGTERETSTLTYIGKYHKRQQIYKKNPKQTDNLRKNIG